MDVPSARARCMIEGGGVFILFFYIITSTKLAMDSNDEAKELAGKGEVRKPSNSKQKTFENPFPVLLGTIVEA